MKKVFKKIGDCSRKVKTSFHCKGEGIFFASIFITFSLFSELSIANLLWKDTKPNEYLEVVSLNISREKYGDNVGGGGVLVGQCVLTSAHIFDEEGISDGFAITKRHEKADLDFSTLQNYDYQEGKTNQNLDIALIRLKSPLPHSIRTLDHFQGTSLPSLSLSKGVRSIKEIEFATIGPAWVVTHLFNNKVPLETPKTWEEQLTHQIEGEVAMIGDLSIYTNNPKYEGMLISIANPYKGDHGDSGSPLYIQSKNGEKLIYAIVSAGGSKDANERDLQAVTLAYHWEWFTTNLNDLDCFTETKDRLVSTPTSNDKNINSLKERPSTSALLPKEVPNITPDRRKRRVGVSSDASSPFQPKKGEKDLD